MSTNNPLEAFSGGITALFIGPPKTGKSTILGSICDLVDPERVALLCAKPNERNSFLYRKHGLDDRAEIFTDPLWHPSIGSYEADGFERLYRRVVDLYKDDSVDAVLVDPLTDVGPLASHALMKGEKAPTPRDMRDSIGFYGALKYKLKELVQAIVGLAAADHPKHVLVAVHARPLTEEDIKGKPTAEAKAKDVSFFGEVLPMIEGSYRQDIAGDFDLVGYTRVTHEYDSRAKERRTNYIVQVTADPEKHGGSRLGAAISEKELPNDMRSILEAFLSAEKAA